MSFLINPSRFASAGVTDPHYANTILLLSGNGAQGSANFTDLSAAAHGTYVGGGTTEYVETGSDKLFGSGSIRFAASGVSEGIGQVRFADHADWTLGTSDFTHELFVKLDRTDRFYSFLSHWKVNQWGWDFHYRGTQATPDLRFIGSADGTAASSIVSGAWSPTAGTWYYLCAERSGSTFRLYVGQPNGSATMLAKATSTMSFFNGTAKLCVSGNDDGGVKLGGFMDEVRLTLGVARYNADAGFTVPTSEFPRS